MPSFTTRRYTPDRLRSVSAPEDDLMEDITTTSVLGPPGGSKRATPSLVPSDGSLLDYFDLPSPPSTPHRAAPSSLSYSSLNSFPSPATSPRYSGAAATGSITRRHSPPSRSVSASASATARSASSSRDSTPSLSAGSSSGSGSSSPASGSGSPSPPTSVLPRWPTASQRIHRVLPTRPRSRSVSSSSSASSSSSTTTTILPTRPGARDMDMDIDTHMSGTDSLLNPNAGLGLSDLTMGEAAAAAAAGGGPAPIYRTARRTPYYPPNASRNVDRTRVFMQRGPHYVPNWTPLSSLPRHVQLRIEESMTRFTAD
ncbi:hypothetical protein B0J18DRAFT_293867 [Chaetomium sp. MPI-SDFR-AT-0129]|nr:hypothetical protein B0J18DRAFT_293867 [Chaetomium sp. MPI-SDFR-AT-0129]